MAVGRRRGEIPAARPLIQPPFLEVDFVETEVMPQLVKEGRPDFLAVSGRVLFGRVPDVFDKKDDLRRERGAAGRGVSVGFSNKEAERIGLDAVFLQFPGGTALERDGQPLRFNPQVTRQRSQDVLNFRLSNCDKS